MAFFNITAAFLQGDTRIPYIFIFIICLDYPAIKITDTDYADSLAVITDYLNDETSLLYNMEKVASKTGLCINASKTEFMCLNQDQSDMVDFIEQN